MTSASLFSGCGGADLGLERAGFRTLWFCENDRAASDVLRYRWPDLTNYGDVRTFPADECGPPDVLWMSPPCQDLSVAGKRAGLAGERSGLFYDAIRIAFRLRDRGTRWVLMEQVPGLFSSNGGEDVRQALGELSDLGVSVAWRVLDSQYFGVPQRRRRAYFVVDLGRERAGEVLALAEGLCGGDPPVRRARTAHAGCPEEPPSEVFGLELTNQGAGGNIGWHDSSKPFRTFDCHSAPGIVRGQEPPRYLMPLEEERGQGWPDHHTRHGRKIDGSVYVISDHARYKQAGNGVTANVAEWIGRNLLAVESEVTS